RLQEEVQGQAKAATEPQTKLQAAQAEQQQQARAVADADSKRKAAEAEQQRLKEEVQRQAKAAADAEAKRKAAEAEQQQLAEEQRKAKAEAEAAARSAAVPQSAPTNTKGLFEIRSKMEGTGPFNNVSYAPSIGACEQNCAQSTNVRPSPLVRRAGRVSFILALRPCSQMNTSTRAYERLHHASACLSTDQASEFRRPSSEGCGMAPQPPPAPPPAPPKKDARKPAHRGPVSAVPNRRSADEKRVRRRRQLSSSTSPQPVMFL